MLPGFTEPVPSQGDLGNNCIRRINVSTGLVTTFVGNLNIGHADGVGSSATFNSPSGVVVDETGSMAVVVRCPVYVAIKITINNNYHNHVYN